jgi:hypothetical protein
MTPLAAFHSRFAVPMAEFLDGDKEEDDMWTARMNLGGMV